MEILKKSQKPRWLHRFDNYKRAFLKLEEAVNLFKKGNMSELEKEGMIQRFEFTWELSWKLLKDYLEDSGIMLETVTPASVIKSAFAAKIIEKGDIWMKALEDRNQMSHTYNFKIFEEILIHIQNSYFPVLKELNVKMLEKQNEFKA